MEKDKTPTVELLKRDMYCHRTPKLKFCPDCNNILAPREIKIAERLFYKCRHCLYQELASANDACVFLNKVKHEVDELALIPTEVIQDPTLARTRDHPCPQCHKKDAVFMQGYLKGSQSTMKLYYVCCDPNCVFKWSE